MVSTHSRLKAAGDVSFNHLVNFVVSTHSRLKAAGFGAASGRHRDYGFNTQPPEGGWNLGGYNTAEPMGFNTQPPEGGWQ